MKALSLICLALTYGTLVAQTPAPRLEISRPGATQPEESIALRVVAWGSNYYGQTNVPAGLSDVRAVAAGGDHTVALKQDGSVVAWGYNSSGQTTVPAGLSGVVAIAAGGDHTVALKQDGTVVAWGGNRFGQTTVPKGLSGVRAIAAGGYHTVALKQNGSVVAWGNNIYGQTTVPAGLSGVVAIAAGSWHTVALKKDGSVVAWGYNPAGQTTVPAGLSGVVAIAAGEYHTVALKQDGSVVAWGNNIYGQTTVPAGLSGVVAIAAGGYHTVALKQDGSVVAWGDDALGQNRVSTDLSGVLAIATGSGQTAAVKFMGQTLLDFGTVTVGHDSERSLTLANKGTADLTGLSVQIIGPDSALFNIVGPNVPSTLVKGSEVNLTVRFTPTGTYLPSATLLISSNAPDYRFSYRVNLTATAPEIVVESPTSLITGNSVALGTAGIGAPALTRIFTIRNIGNGALTGLALSKDGADAADFTLSALSQDTLAAGGSQSFTVSFAPSAVGPHTTTLRLASNDHDENPFVLTLTGQGSLIDFAFDSGVKVKRPSQDLPLDTLNSGTVVERSFILRNGGAQALTGLRLEITGFQAEQFTVIPALPNRLEPGESVSFTLRFTAQNEGYVNTQVRLISDLAQELPPLLNLFGRVKIPRLEVRDATNGQQLSSVTPGKQVIAWGENYYGQTTVPTGLSGVVAIAVGHNHTVALKQDGNVVAWGDNNRGQTTLPTGLSGVVTIAAGDYHTVALRQDGSVIAWGDNDDGQTTVPTGLSGVAAIAAGYRHTVALRQDGSVIAWGYNGDGQTWVPFSLSSVVAIAAGGNKTVALEQDGNVVTWGQFFWNQTNVPIDLSNVVAIAVGHEHSLALKQDGSVVAWGTKYFGQTNVPAGLSNVRAIAAGGFHSVALTQDGSVVCWGDNLYGQTTVPAGLSGVVTIAAGGDRTAVIADPLPLVFPPIQPGGTSSKELRLANKDNGLEDTGLLAISSLTLSGPDADQFRLLDPLPSSIVAGGFGTLNLQLQPNRLGLMTAQLHIASNDPAIPDYVVNLQGRAVVTAAKAGTPGAVFTYAPLRADGQTGLVLQKLTFTNTTGVSLYGLRVILANVAKGITVYSSSQGEVSGTLEVIYSNAIAPGETINFSLVYADPQRRTSAKITPTVTAEALLAPEPEPPLAAGTLVPLASVTATAQGPWLLWRTVPRSTYVVEYSDDAGHTWHSAVHRLYAAGKQFFWIDRGQPETQTVPNYSPKDLAHSRQYRVKKL